MIRRAQHSKDAPAGTAASVYRPEGGGRSLVVRGLAGSQNPQFGV